MNENHNIFLFFCSFLFFISFFVFRFFIFFISFFFFPPPLKVTLFLVIIHSFVRSIFFFFFLFPPLFISFHFISFFLECVSECARAIKNPINVSRFEIQLTAFMSCEPFFSLCTYLSTHPPIHPFTCLLFILFILENQNPKESIITHHDSK